MKDQLGYMIACFENPGNSFWQEEADSGRNGADLPFREKFMLEKDWLMC